MRVLIVGYGRRGRLVEQLALAQGHTIAGRVDVEEEGWAPADVAIDFTTADALRHNFSRYLEMGVPLVIGTTGWHDDAPALRQQAEAAGLGVVASANFSIGVNLFSMMIAEAARLMRAHPHYGAWIYEQHHAAKRDAPSGTAIQLRDTMQSAGFDHPIDVAATRAGSIPGTHTVGFDGESDTLELTHRARDRRGFAVGALLAARWIQGRRGWFTLTDVLKDAG
jgi:4-hydroxy-tetrahydrodipicolinate reductase